MNTITLSAAQRIIDAAVSKADELGVPSTISVLDAGAHLVASVRQDGAPLVSIDSSVAKARTAVFFSTASGDLADAIQPGAPLYTLGDAIHDRLAFIAGGMPLFDADGHVIGAIGAGGGAPAQDAEIATAGSNALGS